jgi:Tfp pilus assembly protein PilN
MWMWGGALYLTAVLGGVGVLAAAWAGDWAMGNDEAAVTHQRIEEREGALAKLRPELDEARQQLAAMKRVNEQPDWSILLAILSQTTGNGIALTDCRVTPKVPNRPVVPATPAVAPARASAPVVTEYSIELSGMGRSQYDVSSFVVRLEQTKLFDRVVVGRASGETGRGGHGVGFGVTCVIECGSTERGAR